MCGHLCILKLSGRKLPDVYRRKALNLGVKAFDLCGLLSAMSVEHINFSQCTQLPCPSQLHHYAEKCDFHRNVQFCSLETLWRRKISFLHLNFSLNCSLQKVKIGPEYNDTRSTYVGIFLTLSSLVSSAVLWLSTAGQTSKPEWNKASGFSTLPTNSLKYLDILNAQISVFWGFFWLLEDK